MTDVGDPNTNLIPGTAQVVAQSEAIRTIVEILRILVQEYAEDNSNTGDETSAEQMLNLMQYLDTNMQTME